LVVRTTTPNAVIEPVRKVARSIDPALPVVEAVTMSEEVNRSLWRERLATALAGGFAAVGLTVAAIGLYVVLAYYVASRRREIGLRMALGARDAEVLRLVTRRMAPVLLLGLLAGAGAHLALGRWLASLLYGVRTFDPAVVGLSGAALLLIALLAGIVPLRRALAVDPASTLRQE
jgi:ABC-type antimicrobial peptide transport system permease subunit